VRGRKLKEGAIAERVDAYVIEKTLEYDEAASRAVSGSPRRLRELLRQDRGHSKGIK
jgi:hypothetical protein